MGLLEIFKLLMLLKSYFYRTTLARLEFLLMSLLSAPSVHLAPLMEMTEDARILRLGVDGDRD